MIQHSAEQTLEAAAVASSGASSTAPTSVWGLSVQQLFDAYWRRVGVQCVRRGVPLTPLVGVDLYLLLEPNQLGLFDLHALAEDLTWGGAPLHRVRIVENTSESYRELAITDEVGCIRRIERRYRSRPVGGLRVLLTRSERLARLWADASTHRDGWTRLRASVAWSRRNHHRVDGWCYTEGIESEERALLAQLIRMWSDPDRTIEGVEEVATDVWALRGTDVPSGATLVGPLWLGRSALGATRETTGEAPILIGPEVITDAPVTQRSGDRVAAKVRMPLDIEPSPVEPRAVPPRPKGSAYRGIKRLIDVAVSATVLLVTLPIILIAGLAVVIDDGWPPFFGHLRQSRGGRLFRCWKFRTMRRDAERLTRELQAQNVCDGPQFFIKDDPRVTRVGRFLRRWHIDEIPQFWNVLVGDMSLVGPRPSPDGENQFCPAWRELRLSVRPGITGLWQVRRTRAPGRDFQEWIRFDIEYVHRAGLLLDARILWETFAGIVLGHGGVRADQTALDHDPDE